MYAEIDDEMLEVYEAKGKTLSKTAVAYLRSRQADPLCSFGDFVAVSEISPTNPDPDPNPTPNPNPNPIPNPNPSPSPNPNPNQALWPSEVSPGAGRRLTSLLTAASRALTVS